MLMAASWPSNKLAAVTKRSGLRSGWLAGRDSAGLLMDVARSCVNGRL
jgi:hypothetical protein